MAERRKITVEELGKSVHFEGKKYMRYPEAAAFFSIGLHSMEDLAKEANAVYHYNRVALVNVAKVDKYLEQNYCY